MNRDRRHQEIQGLLAAYCLGAVTLAEAEAVEAHAAECGGCRDDLARYDAATASLSGALHHIWTMVSGTLAGRREDLDCVLADVLAAGGDGHSAGSPVRVLVAADTEAARMVLASRLDGDDRFAVVGRAASPADVVAEGVSALPDVVVVKLASTDIRWLEAIGELTRWSPRTRLVAVSGLNARHLADLVTAEPMVGALAAGRPPSASVAAVKPASRSLRASLPSPAPAPPDVPRSIIHEVMRQVGLPVRTTP
jgi:CheY-like chemotaxis protein